MKKIIYLLLLILIFPTIQLEEKNSPKNETIKSINTIKGFDIKKYLDEIKSIGCFKDKIHESEIMTKEPINKSCVHSIEKNIFKKLPVAFGHKDLWQLFNNNIYKPLAYNLSKKSNILEILNDLFFVTDFNMISNKDLHSNYEDFENKILHDFKLIETIGSDDDQIQATNNSLVELLKDFHIYWNSLRNKNQINRARKDTLKILEILLSQHQVKEKFVYEITKTLVKKIKEAYGRFMEAHQSLDRIKENGPEIITHLILVRYTSFLEKIKMTESDYVDFVQEITFLLDLTQSFYISSQKKNINEKNMLDNFERNIFEKIKEKYNDFTRNLIDKQNLNVLKNAKHFTVTVLLKLKHLNFITFKYKSLYEIININKTEIPVQKKLTVKIYYEILDNYLSLPKNCDDFVNLKHCITFQSQKILKFITSKYMLKRSVSGWTLYEYLDNLFKNVIKNQEEKNWENMKIFKKQFYKSIFSLLFAYKKKYFIKDTKSLDQLENMIGNVIDNFKKNSDPQTVNFELIDQLDMDIYDEFLEIKSLFDDYVPFSKNLSILDKVNELLFKFIDNFQSEFDDKVNSNFLNLLDYIKKNIGTWKNGFLENEENTKNVDLSAIDNHPDVFLKNERDKKNSEKEMEFIKQEGSEEELSFSKQNKASNPNSDEEKKKKKC